VTTTSGRCPSPSRFAGPSLSPLAGGGLEHDPKVQSGRAVRTFSWGGRNRRLAKDFENLAETLTTFVTLVHQLALRRLARRRP